jgi:hypothetical protein
MNWNQLYGFRSYLKSSLWVVPFIAIPVEFAVTWMLRGVSAWLGWSATAHPRFSGRLGAPTAKAHQWTPGEAQKTVSNRTNRRSACGARITQI